MNADGILANNLGLFVVADFWLGDGTLVTKQGTIETVGQGWFTLRDRNAGTYTLCGLDTLRFLTFVDPEAKDAQ